MALPKHVQDRTRQILNSTELNSFVSDEDEYWLIENVFVHHPDWIIKKGTGILFIQVKVNEGRNTRGFKLHRKEGIVSISILECFKPSTSQQKYLQALRNEVEEQRMKAFLEQGGRKGLDEAHHKGLTFNQIVESFETRCVEIGLDLNEVKKTVYTCEPFGEKLANRDIAEGWRAWHAEYTFWEVVSKQEHKQKHEK